MTFAEKMKIDSKVVLGILSYTELLENSEWLVANRIRTCEIMRPSHQSSKHLQELTWSTFESNCLNLTFLLNELLVSRISRGPSYLSVFIYLDVTGVTPLCQ